MGVPISLAERADVIGRKDPKKVERRTGKQTAPFSLHLTEQRSFLITVMVIDPLTG